MVRKINLFILLLFFSGSVSVFAAKIVPLQELRKPETIAVDCSQIYITESASIYIYSLKDFRLIKKFGQAGEGPDGKFVEKVLVPLVEENIFEFYPYTIHDGKVFQLIDNFETEEWELHITRMK